MSYSKDEFTELAAGYAINALAPEELDRLRELMRLAPAEDLAILADYWEAAMHLPGTVEEVTPSAKVRSALLRKIKGDLEVSKVKPKISWFSLDSPLLSAGIPLILAVISVFLLYQKRNSDIAIKELAEKYDSLQEQVQSADLLKSFLSGKDLKTVELDGLAPSPNAQAKLIWDPQSKVAYLQFTNLPAPPPEKDYQLWMIKDGKPLSASVFSFNNQDEIYFIKVDKIDLASLQDAQTFAVTLEPKGGVPSPTGEMYLKGDTI